MCSPQSSAISRYVRCLAIVQSVPNTGAYPAQVDKAQDAINEKDAAEMMKKMLSNKFDMNDFLEQYKSVRRMGSLSTVVKLIPGMTQVDDKDLVDVEKKFAVYESIINVRGPACVCGCSGSLQAVWKIKKQKQKQKKSRQPC